LILLNSSLPKGIAYIETKGLDGETNLKAKQAHSETVKLADELPNVVRNFTGVNLECDLPNAELYKFQGTLTFADGSRIPLGNDQVLLKGSCLRNTEWVFGVVVYTGHQTKVMKNSLKSRSKKSKIELQTNTYIILTVLI